MDGRNLALDDLDLCLRLQPHLLGDKLAGIAQTRKLWRSLLAAPGFQGVAVIARTSGSENVFAGFGASVLVDEAFAAGELGVPREHLNGRVVSNILTGDSLVFSRSRIEEANSTEGLNVVVLAGRWNQDQISEEDAREVRLHLATTFAGLHSGYRFKRLLTELIDEQDRMFGSSVPIMRIHAKLSEHHALAVVERKHPVNPSFA